MCISSIQQFIYSYVCGCCPPAGRLFNRMVETIHHFGVNCFRAGGERVSPNLVDKVTRRPIGSPFSPLIVRRPPLTVEDPGTPDEDQPLGADNMHFVPSADPSKQSDLEIVFDLENQRN